MNCHSETSAAPFVNRQSVIDSGSVNVFEDSIVGVTDRTSDTATAVVIVKRKRTLSDRVAGASRCDTRRKHRVLDNRRSIGTRGEQKIWFEIRIRNVLRRVDVGFADVYSIVAFDEKHPATIGLVEGTSVVEPNTVRDERIERHLAFFCLRGTELFDQVARASNSRCVHSRGAILSEHRIARVVSAVSHPDRCDLVADFGRRIVRAAAENDVSASRGAKSTAGDIERSAAGRCGDLKGNNDCF